VPKTYSTVHYERCLPAPTNGHEQDDAVEVGHGDVIEDVIMAFEAFHVQADSNRYRTKWISMRGGADWGRRAGGRRVLARNGMIQRISDV
jgi:hypothetical protein